MLGPAELLVGEGGLSRNWGLGEVPAPFAHRGMAWDVWESGPQALRP